MFLCRKRVLNLAPLFHREYRSKVEEQIIDYLEVEAIGGVGGSGCASQEKRLTGKVYPDGANGGVGGDIIIEADRSKPDLSNIKLTIKGGIGGNGGSSHKTGFVGKTVVVPVPVGTRIISLDTKNILADLINHGHTFEVAKGGKGGFGSRTLSGSYERASECRASTQGEAGTSLNIALEMRCIADVGMVGFPNAGKSSLLRALSAAKPKVAAYPFTTLRPHIGVIHYGDMHRVTVADIPGIIKDAHKDCGLGLSFLRHVERCTGLMYVVDMSGPDPGQEISILENEINKYQEKMSALIIAIVANKIDLLPSPDTITTLASQYPNIPIIPISALEGTNLNALRQLLSPYKTNIY